MTNLLIYNPDKSSGNALCTLLRRRDLKPIHHTKAEDILEKVRFGAASILVLDFSSLSSMSALTKDIEEILEFVEKIPVIILSPYSHEEAEMKMLQKQGYYIMEKPVSLEKLVSLIQKLHPKELHSSF